MRLPALLAPTLLSLVFFCQTLYAEENLQIIDVEVNSDQGQPALVVNFNQSIRYRGVLPNRKAREFDIQLQKQLPVVQGNKLLDSRRENISLPRNEGIPIDKLELLVEGDDVHLSVLFSKPVSLRIGQFSGSNSVTIILQKDTLSANELGLESSGKNREEQMMAAGKRALRLGDNALAIRIFKSLVSLPDNPYSRDALEMLGFARERNDQLAQAKLIYDQYLTKYTKNDDARVRVKQRLANLLEVKQKPKKALKKSGKKIYNAYSLMSISQFYNRGLTSIDGQSSVNGESQLNSRFSYLWRKRSKTREVKHYFYAYNLYDFDANSSNSLSSTSNKSVLISSAYSRIKDKEKNYSASVGRQSSRGGGVLGRYDGADLSYGIANKIKLGMILGFPVAFDKKDRVDTKQQFVSTRLDFDDFIKDWNFSSYVYMQNEEGITDRQSIGGEARYFANGLSLYNLIDYDVYFSEMTIYLLRMQYRVSERNSFIFNVDSRRLVETSNALISSTALNLKDLQQSNSEQELKDIALQHTPSSSLTTLGWNHSFANKWESNFDYTKGITELNDINISPQDRLSTYKAWNLLLTKSGLIKKNDLLFLTGRYSVSDASNKISKETSTRLSYRLAFSNMRLLGKYKWSYRDDSDGGVQVTLAPSAKINYRVGKDSDLEFEAGIDFVQYGGTSVNENYTYRHFTLGYQLYF